MLCLAAAFLLPIDPPPLVGAPHSTLVVLGAAQYSGRPSPAFRDRLDHALQLYRSGGVELVVVTGGRVNGDPYSEGGVGVAYLRARGVPEAHLLAEEESRTTSQNLKNAAMMLGHERPITIVTDSLHAPRALDLARGQGLQANANAVQRPHYRWRYRLRERCAHLALLFGYGRS